MSCPERRRRCRTCGNSWFQPFGERTQCPYTLMHERALRGKGLPPANTSRAAIKLRTLAIKFAAQTAPGDSSDRAGHRLNLKLLEAAREYGRVAAHVEAFLKENDS